MGVTHLHHFQYWASHFLYWAMPFLARSFTGPRTGTGLYARGPICGTGLCQSGMVIFRVPYWNWHLRVWVSERVASLSLSLFVTNMRPSQKTKKNEQSTQYRKCDFPLPVLVPLLKLGRPFPVLANCTFGYLHMYFISKFLIHDSRGFMILKNN